MYGARFHPYAGSPWRPGPMGKGMARPPAVVYPSVMPRAMMPQPGFSVMAPGSVAEQNAKAKLNEWMTKTGHRLPYVTVPCEGGFQATLTLPLQGAPGASTAVGVAQNKKMAEMSCAEQALQILANFGMLDVLAEPKRTKPGKAARAVANVPSEAMDFTSAVGLDDFETFKQFIYQQVASNPGKRTTCYMMMCPAGQRRKRVSAALYKLAEDGLIVKHEPTAGKNMVPFWAPMGYNGPLGGNVNEDQLGVGRTLPMTEVKMVLYDILAQAPNLVAREICNQARAMGHAWEVKYVNAALYMMEREGTAQSALESTPVGLNKRWSVK